MLFSQEFIVNVIASSIRLGTPLLLAALGENFAQRSGVMNLGIEGIMAMGALTAFAVTWFTGSIWLGIIAAVIIGIVFSLIHAFVSVTLLCDQVVSGLAIYILGTGLSGFLFRSIFGTFTLPPKIEPLGDLNVPILREIPILGSILFQQNIISYLAMILVPSFSIILFRTTLGLKIRAVGENPQAADSVGINVYFVRYMSVIIGGALAGLAGAFLPITLGIFREYMIAGRGFISFALVIFGRWNPWLILVGALIFGGADALQLRLQIIGLGVPVEFFWMIPYISTIIALLVVRTRRFARGPAALGIPYRRE